jgi:plastocyanin
MKRLLTLIAVIGLIFSISITNAQIAVDPMIVVDPPSPYTDVELHVTPFAGPIFYLSDLGIIGGYDDGTFRPLNSINRVEVAKILIEASYGGEVPEIESTEMLGYSDVISGEWYMKYLKIAQERRIATGHTDGTFGVTDTIVYVEALKMIFETFREELEEIGVVIAEPKDGEDWYLPYLSAARTLDVPELMMYQDEVGHELNRTDFTLFTFIVLDYFGKAEVDDVGTSLVVSTPEIVEIDIENNAFSQNNVRINVGDTVIFTNLDVNPHQVASDSHPSHTKHTFLNGGILQSGDVFEVTFDDAGTYTYHCHLHPGMTGTVVVE